MSCARRRFREQKTIDRNEPQWSGWKSRLQTFETSQCYLIDVWKSLIKVSHSCSSWFLCVLPCGRYWASLNAWMNSYISCCSRRFHSLTEFSRRGRISCSPNIRAEGSTQFQKKSFLACPNDTPWNNVFTEWNKQVEWIVQWDELADQNSTMVSQLSQQDWNTLYAAKHSTSWFIMTGSRG